MFGSDDLLPLGSADAKHWQFETGNWRELDRDDPLRRAGEWVCALFLNDEGKRNLRMDKKGDLWWQRNGTYEAVDAEIDHALRLDPHMHRAVRNLCAGDAGPLDPSIPIAGRESTTPAKSRWPGVQSSGDFVRGFAPPDYLIDGIIQHRFIYSLTAPTGAGKTALALFIAAATALGRNIGDREVTQGRVLYLAGENLEDHRARWIAMADQMRFDPAAIDVHFIPGVFDMAKLAAKVRAEVSRLGGVQLVIVDTSAAYFLGEDENSNVQLGNHARQLRTLTELPGGPCVIVCAHPTKNAGPHDLLPRGGGAYIAEMDGNLTASKEGDVVRLHWQGKFRGAEFDPVPFELAVVTCDGLKDSRGRSMPTVVARPIDVREEIDREADARSDEDLVLHFLLERPGISVREIATAAGWLLATSGDPHTTKVRRAMERLEREKLIAKSRGQWRLTQTGKKEAGRLAERWLDVREERRES